MSHTVRHTKQSSGLDTEYTLHYFPIRGLGELPRLIMEVGGLAYKNTYPVDWKKEKSSTIFGQVPLLIERKLHPDTKVAIGNEFVLAQSGAISRYLARKVGLAGSSETEVALVESIYETLVDIRTHWLKAYYATEEDKPLAVDLFFKENFLNWATFFERFLGRHSADFILNDTLTYADLLLFIICDAWLEYKPDILNARPCMKKVYNNVKAHPKVASYLISDRRHRATFTR
jgi:glutathione S-transferase